MYYHCQKSYDDQAVLLELLPETVELVESRKPFSLEDMRLTTAIIREPEQLLQQWASLVDVVW
jgi:hypothetical protein